MFLKQLDIIGFKSFADRVSIDFIPGVTAVVGPNGSGKSNILEAVRWVLGEQSAKSLRGGKMEDVIFNGSDSRKPLNYAGVTLTLNNENKVLPIDYSEVNVTRRVYRTGESEYFINKQQCRLKDIIELFMDSGLGREAFSIISQGKIDEILNNKAEDRRTIFEEAAGVLKYKTRKKKSEIKLDETAENLNRVNDILHELESQLEPLKRQASIAKDYLEKKKELKANEVALTVYEIERLHERWEKLKKEFATHQQQELNLVSQMKTNEAKLEEKRNRMHALDESIDHLQKALLTVSEELEQIEGRKKVLKERRKNSLLNKEQLQTNLKEANEKLQKFEADLQTYEKMTSQQENDIHLLQKQLQKKKEQLSIFNEDTEEMIESLKSDYIERLNEQATAKNEKQLIEKQLEQLAIRKKKLDHDNEKYLKERTHIKERKRQIAFSIDDIQTKLANELQSFHQLEHRLEKLKNNYEKQEKKLYKAYQYLQQAKSRKETLQEMEADYSGFFQGVREVLKARTNNLTGIEGAVAELIQVPKEYQTAIETTVGNAMQHIVVKTEANAREAIKYLKTNRYGRATFLPLNIIRKRTIPNVQRQILQNNDAFVSIAADLVQYNRKYENIIYYLLGNVVIAKDLPGANQIANLLQYRYRIVTLEGDIVNPGGSMTGGAQKQKRSSLLSRKNELKELKNQLVVMEKETTALEEKVKALKKEIANAEKELENIRAQGEKYRFKEQEQKAAFREAEIEEKNLNDRLKIYDLEKSEFDSEKMRLTKRTQEISLTLEQTLDQLEKLDQKIAQLNEQKHSEKTSKEKLIAEISECKEKLAVKKEQLLANKKQLERLQAEKTDILARIDSLEEDQRWLQNEMNSNDFGENELDKSAKKKLQEKNDTISLISLRREKRLSMQQQIEDEEVTISELKRQHQQIVNVLKDEEVKLNRLDVELETRLNQLSEKYTLSFEAAKKDYPLQHTPEETKKEVHLIKKAIEELGTVNIGAIEEYERISERHRFLTVQKNDLVEAKETLYEIIREMDEEMVKRFGQTFHAIQQEFETVFQALFGGGRAELQLTDPDDLLHTGIEIVAQPPGKKLQNLALLSGGERALTAIALLFSILRVRPVPFCILDEVEAALDEANVYRFSQYLKQFSAETQFIVITHRKGTMEGADALYGVTMQESGVSKLVSVRLEDAKDLMETS